MNSFRLDDRVVLLTGAAGYLGSAMAKAIVSSGARLVAVGRSEQKLEELKASLPDDQQSRVRTVVCDLQDMKTALYLRSLIEKEFGHVHGLINNAYAGRTGPLEVIEAEDFLLAAQHNLTVPFSLIKALLPVMEQSVRDSGRTASIVNIASMYGSVSPDPAIYGDSGKNNPVHYGATKAGLIQMTRYLACHLGARGIRVNSVSPGPFPQTVSDPGIPGFYQELARKVPMGRVGKPMEVAGPVVFLLSAAAEYVNGVNLPVDGGWTAW